MTETPRTPFTLDEIIGVVSDIARDTESRDRLRALKLLTSLNSSVAAIPPPLNDDEVVERITKLMKAAGPRLCRRAYRKAYPLKERVPAYDHEERDDIGEAVRKKVQKLRTLRQYNKMFPEVKKPTGGVPPGYPIGSGPEAQMEWVQSAATKILIERRRREIAIEAADIKATEKIPELEDDS